MGNGEWGTEVDREEVELSWGVCLFKAKEYNAGLAVARAGQEERRHFETDGIEHCVRRVCGLREHDRPHDAVAPL